MITIIIRVHVMYLTIGDTVQALALRQCNRLVMNQWLTDEVDRYLHFSSWRTSQTKK